MTRRQARRLAHAVASYLLQRQWNGKSGLVAPVRGAERKQVERELEALATRHFEQSGLAVKR